MEKAIKRLKIQSKRKQIFNPRASIFQKKVVGLRHKIDRDLLHLPALSKKVYREKRTVPNAMGRWRTVTEFILIMAYVKHSIGFGFSLP